MRCIGLEVTKRLINDLEIRVEKILVRPEKEEVVIGNFGDNVRVIFSINDLDPISDFVLECASHDAFQCLAHIFSIRVLISV